MATDKKYRDLRNGRYHPRNEDLDDADNDEPIVEKPVVNKVQYGVVNTGVMNVHSTPNSSYSENIIRRLYKATRVIILSQNKGWTKIRLVNEPTFEGYAVSMYLDLE